ncbi:50S ribosomal protein L15 [Candidatus Roizmanbacteria bacterium]|nr:50S ribosomal protein L15 [Candidatus Roizmanbacteria bacterium]
MSITLSSLPKIVTARKKRVGRGLGSGKGAKSGRGTTRHQKARESIPLHFEGGQGKLVKKFPLLRGKGKNKSVHSRPFLLSLNDLNRFKDGETITVETLRKNGAIPLKRRHMRVKVVATGVLEKKLHVQLPVSRSVKTLVEKAGGHVDSV